MREAQIILSNVSPFATTALRVRLRDTFGGYTQHIASGVWRDPATNIVHDDINHVFTVAAELPDLAMAKLREIAREAGRASNQVCVYLKGFDGEVEFVACG